MNEPTTVIGLAGLVLVLILPQTGLWLDQKRRSRITDGRIASVGDTSTIAATEAAIAAAHSAPMGNGFPGRVLTGLTDINGKVDALGGELHEVRRKLDSHIGDHASADVRRGSTT